MSLRNLIERECRFHGEMNHDGTISENVVLRMNRETLRKYQHEVSTTSDGIFLGDMRVLIDGEVGDGLVMITEQWRKAP